MILMQTKTIFIDAYRELNAKKLFWLTMGLNVLVVALYASLGINAKGVTFLHWTFDSDFMNTSFISRELFYKIQFTSWGVPIWLSWATTILALISTAGIIPDMVSGGTIEPMLSKPIGRVRFFLSKYLTGLLFVGLQIFVFATGCLLVLGIRAGTWEFGLFMAIPIVLAFFSYLFAFCVLVGLVTRSTIAALLLTILFWLLIFIANTGDAVMLSQREGAILRVEDRQVDVEVQERFAQKRLEQFREQDKPIPGEGDVPLPASATDTLSAVNPTLTTARNRLQEAEDSVPVWQAWSKRVFLLKTVLPKTQETIALLERHLISDDELSELMKLGANQQNTDENQPAMADPRVPERVAVIMRARTIWWVLGTSFAFEAILLGLSTLIFVRRDF
jgi:ABC-type transport system involved in multi-copper enzyme maturation permease subunit